MIRLAVASAAVVMAILTTLIGWALLPIVEQQRDPTLLPIAGSRTLQPSKPAPVIRAVTPLGP